jgi:hypothetical protein
VNWNVTVLLPRKPEPDTLKLLPRSPLVGLRDKDGAVTVKTPEAELTPSLANTMSAPTGAAVGTVILVAKAPVESATTEPVAMPATWSPTVPLGLKPAPLTLMDAPRGPVDGLTASDVTTSRSVPQELAAAALLASPE